MKHKISIFFLSTFFSCICISIAFAMEPGTTNNDIVIINAIDEAINRQHSDSFADEVADFFAQGLGKLAMTAGVDPDSIALPMREKARKTMNVFSQSFRSISLNQNNLAVLYTRNKHFKNAIEFYINVLLMYYQKITIEDLNKVLNVELVHHPVEELGQLTPIIKKYIAQCSLGRIAHEYIMEFSEKLPIRSFDVCEYDTIHLAATSSLCNHISIWDLFTGKLMHQIETPEDIIIEQVCFNPTGTQIAASLSSNTQHTLLGCKIWDPKTKSVLHTIPNSESVFSLWYLSGTLDNTLVLTHRVTIASDKYVVWQIDETPQYKGCRSVGKAKELVDQRTTQSYYAPSPLYEAMAMNTLWVTKRVCPYFYLCVRAIDNAKDIATLKRIEGTLSFINSTDYEKGLVRKDVRNKIDALSIKQAAVPKTNTLLLNEK